MVGGYFNVISLAIEKNEGAPANGKNMKEFKLCTFSCGLSPVDFNGQLYTWTNGSMWLQLDRMLVNSAWTNLFDTTWVSLLAQARSNHCPLMVKYGSTRI